MRYVFTIPGVRDDGIDRTESYEMEGGQVFRPALFGEQPSTLMQREFDINRGLFQFELLDTPVKETLRASLENRRPPTVLAQQAAVVRRVIGWTTIMLVVLSLLLSVARFVLSGAESTTWFAFLVVLQLYMVIPFLPFAGIIMWTLVRAFGNAKVLTLFEQLQQSTTPFDDREDVDEFDEEAAPPTKDVQLATGRRVCIGV